MKKFFSFALIFSFGVVLSGCGDDNHSAAEFQSEPSTPPGTIIMKYDSSSGEISMAKSTSYISESEFKTMGSKIQEYNYQTVNNFHDDEWNDNLNNPQEKSWHVFRKQNNNSKSKKSQRRVRQTGYPYWWNTWYWGSNYYYPYWGNYYYYPTYYCGGWYPYYGYGSSCYYNYNSCWYYPYYCHY